MSATISQQKTGWYVTYPSGEMYADRYGDIWFTKPLARQIAIEIGGWYEQGARGTIKRVVIGYPDGVR